jgi:hypothetical protein
MDMPRHADRGDLVTRPSSPFQSRAPSFTYMCEESMHKEGFQLWKNSKTTARTVSQAVWQSCAACMHRRACEAVTSASAAQPGQNT